jgi:hypothetical protein
MGMLNEIFERYWGTVTVAAAQKVDTAPVEAPRLALA